MVLEIVKIHSVESISRKGENMSENKLGYHEWAKTKLMDSAAIQFFINANRYGALWVALSNKQVSEADRQKAFQEIADLRTYFKSIGFDWTMLQRTNRD